KQADSRSSFNELLDTPLDFSNFTMNRLRVDTLTLELLDGPTFELMKGSYYGQIKWIEDLVPRTMWIQEPIDYDNYQKRLNLTKPDTYRSDLKQKEAYTAYSNPRGFIYQNKDKKNRLMRINELHKFSDGTLNDVRNALDDSLKGIRMQAATMIQAIDKMLKTRRIMRSLEKFFRGRSILTNDKAIFNQSHIRPIALLLTVLNAGNIKMEVKESKAYKTYLAYAIGTVPPKVARKFKKASTSIKDSVPVSADEEHVQKGKRVKRSAKKSSTTPTTCIIREPPVETQTKRKEKMKEVRKKSLRDFHKSHPSGSDSESNQQDDDDEDKDDDDDDEDDDNDDDKSECDEDKGIDSDDVQDKKADVRMTDAQQEKENLETTQEQVVEDAHVKITKKTKVPVTSSSRSSDLVSKFLKF
nr:hypothetical protein [Tanacetum cinerariifolium]